MSSTVATRRALLKALSIAPGGGAEVTLQQTIAAEVIPLIRQANYLRQIADKYEGLINMTKPLVRVPRLVRAQGAYVVQAGKPAPTFDARLEGVDLRPEKMMAWLPIDQEVFEDSTIKDMEGMLKQEMAREFAQGEEIAWLHGDREGVFPSGDSRNGFDGLFKQAAAAPLVYDPDIDTTIPNSGADVIVSNLIRACRNLGIYGRNKKEIVIMIGTAIEERLTRSESFQRMSSYAYGSGAGIFNGEIGRLNGATVVATTWLDAQPGDTYSKALVMNSSCFVIGDWQQFSIRVYDEILSQTDQTAIRARERVAFAVRYPEAIVSIEQFPAQP
ncbi:MAG: hypothetical protein DDT26_00215 [Dehalococcoidia bacterium]|nr:hypothetical protein [Chloroflexota bacterium]